MITVRFPNGHAIQYNNMHFVWHTDNGTWKLGENETKPSVFIQASAGAVVEFTSPCRVYNGEHAQPLAEIQKEVHALRRKIVLSNHKTKGIKKV